MITRDKDRPHVAWDLETTGFNYDAQITTSGFWFLGENGFAVLVLNTNGAATEADRFEAQLENVSGATVTVRPAADETELLETMRRVLFERFDRDYNRLTAFHADSWKGGFDLPFIRTRCLARGVDWVFDGIEFCDLWEPITKRVNTNVRYHDKTDDVNSLTGAHDILFEREEAVVMLTTDETAEHPWYHDRRYDPFTDSGSAAVNYDRGEVLSVMQHNLADIHRTWELGELVRRVVPSKDITTKKL